MISREVNMPNAGSSYIDTQRSVVLSDFRSSSSSKEEVEQEIDNVLKLKQNKKAEIHNEDE